MNRASAALSAGDVPTEADFDAILAPVRAGHMRISNGKATTSRMARILKRLGVTGTQHSAWCGFSPKEWVKSNPGWTEREWALLVAENIERIKAE